MYFLKNSFERSKYLIAVGKIKHFFACNVKVGLSLPFLLFIQSVAINGAYSSESQQENDELSDYNFVNGPLPQEQHPSDADVVSEGTAVHLILKNWP